MFVALLAVHFELLVAPNALAVVGAIRAATVIDFCEDLWLLRIVFCSVVLQGDFVWLCCCFGLREIDAEAIAAVVDIAEVLLVVEEIGIDFGGLAEVSIHLVVQGRVVSGDFGLVVRFLLVLRHGNALENLFAQRILLQFYVLELLL